MSSRLPTDKTDELDFSDRIPLITQKPDGSFTTDPRAADPNLVAVEIYLTKAEVKFIRSFCLLRPMKKAVELLLEQCTDSLQVDVAEDLEQAGPVFESIRQKLVNQIMANEIKQNSAKRSEQRGES